MHTNLIKQRMLKLDNMTADFLANLAGIPGTRLSLAFRGVRELDNDQIVHLSNTLQQLEDLAAALAPIPVAFKNPRAIREVLEQRKNGNLIIEIKDNS
jgi:hypothetical protein